MSDRRFVHLHCHTHYSLLDGAGSVDKLVKRAKSHGMNGLAITDHGNLHGAVEFYRTCKGAGINPILGMEAYIAPGSRFEKEAGSMKEASYHLTLLAQNRTGFKNLIKMASAAMLEGFYFKPRIDKALLEQYHEGIICLSGCVSSEFSRALLKGSAEEDHFKEATEVAQWFHKLFGDRYFIEVMNNGVDIQRLQLEAAVDLAKKVGLPLVATSDCHYVDADDAEAQDVMLCINTGKFRTDSNRMRMDGNQYFLRSPEQMYEAFPGLDDAVARSQEIADSIHIDLELGKRNFPTYTIPDAKTPDDYLRELCETGLKERYAGDEEMLPGGELSERVMKRLNRELSCISKLGFSNYFLIVWDFVRYSRERDIPATARGSGVGALVCYALYLSHVCPLKYDLLFERFLDENRREAPDIDIDFCKERRVDVIRYVKEKYGEANVAQIGTFGTLAARAAIKDVGRVLGMPLDRVNKVTGMVPEELGIELDDAIEKSLELNKAYNSDPEVRELLDLARKIEGLARNIGTHAAAVVIADKPLTEYVPLGRVTGKQDIITQWSMGDVEAAGLLKMDFLGLRNLTILSKAVDLIQQTTGVRVDPYKFPVDDKKTYALLQRGETKGIFQLESGGIRDLLQKMKPDHFADIIATNALYRPGPLEGGMVRDYVEVKHGRQKAEYIHPICEKILSETNGVMVYQEQVMRILNELGGIELANSYTCIKAISKKKEDLIAINKDQFLKGSQEKGISLQQAEDFWNMIIKFAGYGFNKCLVGATRIVDASNGEATTIEDLFFRRREFTIDALGDDGRLRPRPVRDVVWNGRKPVFALVTALGRRIVATDNHPFRTPQGWTELGRLAPGDLVAARRPSIRLEDDPFADREYADRDCAVERSAYDPLSSVSRMHDPGCAAASAAVACAVAEPCAASFEALEAIDPETLAWDSVVSITPQGVQDTYDLEVEGDHNFVADGLVVHNSHSTAYALIAYMTAYLKAHYPVEFMAALLCGDIEGRNFKTKDALVEHLEDCKRMNIEIVWPSVNTSHVQFAVGDGRIYFGLSAIKGCGGSAAEALVAERKKNGPYKDLFDFCERVDSSGCPKAAIESLIKAGAFDCFQGTRKQFVSILDRALQSGAAALADRRTGQKSLFGGDDEDDQKKAAIALPDVGEFEDRERLMAEKEVLGFYLSSHPLAPYEKALSEFCSHTIDRIPGVPERSEVILGGMMAAIKMSNTKNPKPGAPSKYAMFDLEDMTGTIRCILWPDDFVNCGEQVKADAILVVRGSIDRRGGDEANLIVNELIPMEELGERYTTGIMVRVDEVKHGSEALHKLREILRGYPGARDLELLLTLRDGARVKLKSNKTRLDVTQELQQRIDDLLGAGNLRRITAPPKANTTPAPGRQFGGKQGGQKSGGR